MILDEIQDVIDNIAAEPSTNKKIELLKEQSDNELFKKVLLQAYSPRIRFYLKPMEVDDKQKEPSFDFWFLLEALSSRTISGNEARNEYAALKVSLSDKKQRLLDGILGKDLRAGVSSGIINKAIKGLIPETQYMRCSLITDIKKPNDWLNPKNGVISQEKLDGMFVNINVSDDGVEITSRNGSVFPEHKALDDIKQGVFDYFDTDYQYHGELLVYDKHNHSVLPREIGNGILNSIQKSDKSSSGDDFDFDNYYVAVSLWDMIPFKLLALDPKEQEGSEYNAPYSKRLENLNRNVYLARSPEVKLVETRHYDNLSAAEEHFKEMLSLGHEGCVVKLPDMLWKDGTSRNQVKLKNKFTVELKITGFLEGTGKNKDLFGAISCESSDGKLLVNVSSSGFTDKHKKEISDNRDSYIGKIMSVTANSIMRNTDKAHSLFLPVFEEFRLDKNEADSYQRIEEQFANSVNLQNQIEKLKSKVKPK
jgi:ATP dependent DNA ligase domain